ncbi:MAG TPA: cellulase family glycosylhydrolase, partial [Jiangellales bacterium]|nr:cellulase family glycosylhydrolase [Jiangellales bacterium]
VLLVLALAALSVAPGAARDLASAPRGTDEVPHLVVQGTVLREAGGERFVVAGAADYLLPFYAADDGGPDPAVLEYTERSFRSRDAAFEEMRRAGINLVRVPLGPGPYVDDVYGLGGKQGYLRRLEQVLDSAHRAGLVVLLGWWPDEQDLTDAGWSQRLLSMMADVAGLVGDRPGVMIEPVNEPALDDWPSWSGAMTDLLTFWREDLAWRGVLVVDTPGFSWSLAVGPVRRLLAVDGRLLGGDPQLLVANHRYANDEECFCGDTLDEWVAEIGQHVDEVPVLGTEYGWFNAGFPVSDRWNQELFDHLATVAVPAGLNGAVAFLWSWVDPNSMTLEDGMTLGANGTQFRDAFALPVGALR